jgi:hypothetical protein
MDTEHELVLEEELAYASKRYWRTGFDGSALEQLLRSSRVNKDENPITVGRESVQ